MGQPTEGSISRASALLWSRVTSFHPCSKTPPWGLSKLKKWSALFFECLFLSVCFQKLHGWKIQISSSLVSPLLWHQAASFFHSPLAPYKGKFFFLKCCSSTPRTHFHLKNSAWVTSSRKPSKQGYVFSDLPTAPVLPSFTAIYGTQY